MHKRSGYQGYQPQVTNNRLEESFALTVKYNVVSFKQLHQILFGTVSVLAAFPKDII